MDYDKKEVSNLYEIFLKEFFLYIVEYSTDGDASYKTSIEGIKNNIR